MSARALIASLLVFVLCSCAAERSTGPDVAVVTTYYDRNGDDRVDYELHDHPTWTDDAWALADDNFDRRYETKYAWGFSGTRTRVDVPVAENVRITSGAPKGGFGFPR